MKKLQSIQDAERAGFLREAEELIEGWKEFRRGFKTPV
jgi:hypothetical protein